MATCSAWEIWRIQHHIVDTVVIVNLTPLEGVPFLNGQADERVSVYLREEELFECVGILDDETLLHVANAYLHIRANAE